MSRPFKVGIVAPSASITSASISSASINAGTLTNMLHVSGSNSGTLTNLGFISGGSANFISASINGVAISTGGGGGTSSLNIQNSGTVLTTNAGSINFVGPGIVASLASSGSINVTAGNTVTANAGFVGNWNLGTSGLTTSLSPYAGLLSGTTGTNPIFFAGATDALGTNAGFSVSSSGFLTSSSANITTANITTSNLTTGNITTASVKGGAITSSVTILGGDGAGLHFNSTTLSVTGGSSTFFQFGGLYTNPQSTTDIFIWSGSAFSSYTVAPFRVTYGGDVVARNANFTAASVSGSAIATTNFVTGQGYLISSGSIATASNSASLGGLAASAYATVNNPTYTGTMNLVNASATGNIYLPTTSSVGGNPIYTLATAPYQSIPFSYTGSVSVYTGSARFYNDTGGTRSIVSVRASVGTAPVGANMIVDVRKNGISASNTIFTASGLTIAAGTNTSASTTGFNSGSSVVSGDYLTIAITQVGSTTPGSDLSVVVNWR